MAKTVTNGVPRYIDLRLFFKEDGELHEIMIVKEKTRSNPAEGVNYALMYPHTDVPFEEYIGMDEIVYAGQIEINGGKDNGGTKIVILQDPKEETDL